MPDTWTRALVTGASSGIGRAIASQLAGGGTDLVLVARTAAALEDVAALARRRGVEADVLPADLADPDDVVAVETRLAAHPPVDLLVNNAGFGTYGQFHTLDIDEELREIAVNVVAPVRLTRAVLGGMVDRGRGWIMNISSMASLQPSPRNATYGATKAFVTSFSESLHEELRGTGVRVTAVLPGFTRTEFQASAGLGDTGGLPGFVWQEAEDCAAAALAGTRAGRAVVVPGRLNKVTAAAAAGLPRGAKRRLVGVLSTRFKH
jgi:short-subunit dehydrogenase